MRAVEPFEPYIDDDGKRQVRLTNEMKAKIRSLYERAGATSNGSLNLLDEAFHNCSLATPQLEPLIVAYGIFLQLAEIEFDPLDNRSFSAERKGEERFVKTFKLTAAVRRLCYAYDIAPAAFLYLILNWIVGQRFNSNTPFEKERDIIDKQLKEQIMELSALTVYRYRESGSSSIDRYFNTIGLYEALLEGAELDLASFVEPKGTLRILKAAVRNGLLPGLSVDKGKIGLDSNVDSRYVRRMLSEQKKLVDLRSLDYRDLGSRITVDIEKRQGDNVVKNVILYGVPGSGKSFKIDTDHVRPTDKVRRVVFHPDYMYTNFIGQILPVVKSGDVSYEFAPGPFASILREALNNPADRYVLIIEEINRGNAPAIFGDVFQLLDRDHNGDSRYGIFNSDLSQLIYGEYSREVRIPSNLILLATMNTSDQNVFTLDTAFQRRWAMEIVPNNLDTVPWGNACISGTSVSWKRFVREINREIVNGADGFASNEDKRLGAFFATQEEVSDPSGRLFAEKVLKYLWDDAFKFYRGRIFSDADARTLEDVIGAFVGTDHADRWNSIFVGTLVSRLTGTNSPENRGELKGVDEGDVGGDAERLE